MTRWSIAATICAPEKIRRTGCSGNPKVEVIWDHGLDEVLGETKAGQASPASGWKHATTTGAPREIPAQGVFIAIGHAPASELVAGQLPLHSGGYVKVKPGGTATEILVSSPPKSPIRCSAAVTSAGMGCMAALEAERYLAARETVEAGAGARRKPSPPPNRTRADRCPRPPARSSTPASRRAATTASVRCRNGISPISTPRPTRRRSPAISNGCAPNAPMLRHQLSGQARNLDAAGLLGAIQRYERIQTVSGRVASYAGLRYYQSTTDPTRAKFFGDTQGALTDSPLAFFSLELNRVEDSRLDGLLGENPALARYKPVLDRIRAMKPYQLSDELEQFLHDQSVVGAAAWNRLFDETLAGLEFTVGDETLEAGGDANPCPTRPRPPPCRPRRWPPPSAPNCRSSPASPTRCSRRRRSRTAGASCRRRRRRAFERCRARGGTGAARRRGRRLSPSLAPLLCAEGALDGPDQLEIWDRNAPLPRDDDRVIPTNAGRLCELILAWPRWPSRSSTGTGSTRR